MGMVLRVGRSVWVETQSHFRGVGIMVASFTFESIYIATAKN